MTKYKFLNTLALAALLLAACGGPATTAAPTTAPGETAAPEETAAPDIPEVPRNQTLTMGWSVGDAIGTTNPWALGYSHQSGNAVLWEGLSYYAIYADKEIPWLAESMTYNDDFTELTVKIRPEAAWSDGTPVSSNDVVFLVESQMKNEKLGYHAQFDQFVQEVKATDDKTAVITFKTAAPRFKFEVLTLHFDTGVELLPAHVLGNTDVITDVNAYAGGLDMPHSGPYTIVFWDATQKVMDLREDWWAVEAGIAEVPDVKRVIVGNIGGQIGQSMDVVAQRVTNNELDTALDFRQDLIASILEQNPKVTSHTANTPPYGYLDWWPNSLWMNTAVAPYDDVRVRRAVSLAIDRDKVDEIVYDGAKVTTIYPFPLYPGLKKFADSPAVKALEEQYQPRKFDLEESAALLTEAGFAKNADGLWAKDGQTINATIHGFSGIHGDIVPVLEEMLKTAGFDAAVDFSDNSYNAMANGEPGLYMFGHGASLVDPFETLQLYHGKYSAAVGSTAGNNRFSRYKNPEYDAILDQMAPLPASDPKFQELAAQALGIYWRDQIDVPMIQWLHRIAYNQTNWTNWPTEANLGFGGNGAFWHHTGMLVVTTLKAAQ